MSKHYFKTSAMLMMNGMEQGANEIRASFEARGGTVQFQLRWLRGQEWGVVSEFWPDGWRHYTNDENDEWRNVVLLDDAGALPPLGATVTSDEAVQRTMAFNSNRPAREHAFAGRCLGCAS